MFCGDKVLVNLTKSQVARLWRVTPAYVAWALKRMRERFVIESGLVPLVPPPPSSPKKLPLLPVPMVDDAEIVEFVRRVGVDRVLDAAVAVEAAQSITSEWCR